MLPLLAAAHVTAQEPKPPQVASSALLLRVRSPQCDLDTAREVASDISTRAVTVRSQFFGLLHRRYKTALQSFEHGRGDLRKRLDKVVPKVQRQALAAAGSGTVDELRKQALAVSRKADLTKAMIKAQIDPKLERLQELLLPDVDAILDADDALADRLDDLADEHDDLLGWFDLYADTRRGLIDCEEPDRATSRIKPLPEPPNASVLDDDIAVGALFSLPLSGRDKKTLQKNAALQSEMVAEEYLGTLELNRIRIALGLATVRIDLLLGNAARGHSEDMKRLNFFSHTSPIEKKKTPGMRAALAGTSGGAENIANGHQTGAGAVEAWWYSPGHHRNMLGGHARTGLGQAGLYWTQMFGS
ncbi:MAG: CAP domain-containing protein [bacterium]|nr:CAP domain-containing protein [bacterium]